MRTLNRLEEMAGDAGDDESGHHEHAVLDHHAGDHHPHPWYEQQARDQVTKLAPGATGAGALGVNGELVRLRPLPRGSLTIS
jgi:hypothetical protein